MAPTAVTLRVVHPAPTGVATASDPWELGHPDDRDEGGTVQVQIHTGKHVDAKSDWFETEVLDSLSRYGEQITRVEVHLSDQNAEKSGADDLRCTIDAHLAGLKTQAVTHSAANVHDAFSGALHKLTRSVETTFAKVEARRGRDSIRHPDHPQMLPEEFAQ